MAQLEKVKIEIEVMNMQTHDDCVTLFGWGIVPQICPELTIPDWISVKMIDTDDSYFQTVEKASWSPIKIENIIVKETTAPESVGYLGTESPRLVTISSRGKGPYFERTKREFEMGTDYPEIYKEEIGVIDNSFYLDFPVKPQTKIIVSITGQRCSDQLDDVIPVIFSDEEGFVNCPYCKEIHRHGGQGNGIAIGHRMPDCGNKKGYIVGLSKKA